MLCSIFAPFVRPRCGVQRFGLVRMMGGRARASAAKGAERVSVLLEGEGEKVTGAVCPRRG